MDESKSVYWPVENTNRTEAQRFHHDPLTSESRIAVQLDAHDLITERTV